MRVGAKRQIGDSIESAKHPAGRVIHQHDAPAFGRGHRREGLGIQEVYETVAAFRVGDLEQPQRVRHMRTERRELRSDARHIPAALAGIIEDCADRLDELAVLPRVQHATVDGIHGLEAQERVRRLRRMLHALTSARNLPSHGTPEMAAPRIEPFGPPVDASPDRMMRSSARRSMLAEATGQGQQDGPITRHP